MTKSSTRSVAALLAAAVSACATAAPAAPRATAVQPAPAAEPSPPAPPAVQADTVKPRWSPADVRFMQGMIGHHAQALTMTALVPARSARADVRLLAERIEASQLTEISQMRQWLQTRGLSAAAPAADGHQHQHPPQPQHQHGPGGDHAAMPGMLSERELASLAAASGAEFDRLFLEYMIRHHEGALAMVATLLATNGAGQEPEIFRLATDVDADQRAEVARMRAMQGAPAPR
jgi:uncharacterized protein (DUF305 family)